jgi:integrase
VITAAIGSHKARGFGARQARTFLFTLPGRGYSKSTISQIRVLAATAWDRYENELAGRNPWKTKKIMPDAPTRRSRALTVDQAVKVLGYCGVHIEWKRGSGGRVIITRLEMRESKCTDPMWRAYLVTALLTPERPGELAGLRWVDLDTENKLIDISKSLHCEDGKLFIGDLKTPWSKGTITMPDAVHAVLVALKRQHAADKLKAGSLYQDHGLVFCRPNGLPLWRGTVNVKLNKIINAAGVEGHWQPRELGRHSAISLLSAMGVPLEEIADVARHKNATITAQVYRHVITETRGATAVWDAGRQQETGS